MSVKEITTSSVQVVVIFAYISSTPEDVFGLGELTALSMSLCVTF